MPTPRSLITARGRTTPVQTMLFETPELAPRAAAPAPPSPIAFATLASSSSGNASVLRVGTPENHRLVLIDCGVSPRRTRALLADLGTGVERIDDVVLTHLDQDHCHRGWAKSLPSHARFRLLRRHLARARRSGIAWRKTEVFEQSFSIPRLGTVRPTVMSHDELGVVSFRFDLESGVSLGYATDLGRSSDVLERALAGVDVLAIESNYCPRLQELSDRPAFVKHRITGGFGHLSNQQSAELVRAVAPSRAVILLHLSRQCNSPDRALAAHAHHACEVIAAPPDEPLGWIDLGARAPVSSAPPP